MMRVLMSLVLAAMFLYINAAPKTFSVQAPNWNKVAICDTDGGINIRKTPSTSAARYVSRCDDPYDYWNTTEYWSTSKLKENERAVTFNGVAPIVSEQNGWYELYAVGPNGENGWVSAKFCEIEEPRSLKPGQYNTADFVWLKNNSNGGDYAIYCEYEEMDGWSTFYIGRLCNGVLVCPYSFSCNAHYEPDKTPGATTIRRNDNGEEWTMISFTYGENESTRQGFDLSKFSPRALESIVDCALEMEKPVYVFRMNGRYIHT